MGYLLQAQGNLLDAEPLFERALAIREKVLGSEHPDTATSLSDLAILMRKRGDLASAASYSQRALVIFDKALGLNHPWTQNAALDAAGTLAVLGRAQEAKALREKYGIRD